MSRKKKLTHGRGWSLEGADEPEVQRTVSLPPDEQRVKVSLVKRSKGKVVTLASGFMLTPADLTKVAKVLRQECGCGGTAKDGAVELQGDHVDKVRQGLVARGYRIH